MILAHLSDFHLRPDYSEICLQKLKQIKECIDQYKVDIVVYTGDTKNATSFRRVQSSQIRRIVRDIDFNSCY